MMLNSGDFDPDPTAFLHQSCDDQCSIYERKTAFEAYAAYMLALAMCPEDLMDTFRNDGDDDDNAHAHFLFFHPKAAEAYRAATLEINKAIVYYYDGH